MILNILLLMLSWEYTWVLCGERQNKVSRCSRVNSAPNRVIWLQFAPPWAICCIQTGHKAMSSGLRASARSAVYTSELRQPLCLIPCSLKKILGCITGFSIVGINRLLKYQLFVEVKLFEYLTNCTIILREFFVKTATIIWK